MKTRVALCLGIVLLIALPAYAGPAYIQSTATHNDTASLLKLTFPRPVTAGSLLVVAVRMSNGGHATITSNPAATWTEDAWRLQTIASGWSYGVYSAPNVTGGTTTVAATVSGSTAAVRMAILEYSGIATTAQVHKTSSAVGTSGSANSGWVTTTVDNCLLFCGVATDSDLLGFVAGSGYTLRVNAHKKNQTGDRGPVPAGMYSGTMTLKSDTWAAILVAYKPKGSVSYERSQ